LDLLGRFGRLIHGLRAHASKAALQQPRGRWWMAGISYEVPGHRSYSRGL